MNEKVIEEFSKLGCTDRSVVISAAHVYLELCEVKKYYNVQYKYEKHLDLIYLAGNKTRLEPSSIFIPVPTTRGLSFKRLQSFIDILNKPEEPSSAYIVLVHPDTTCIYYQVHDGLQLPKEEAETKRCETIDLNIRKHRKVIEEAAMCGVPITIPNLIKREINLTENDTIEDTM